MGCLSVLLRVLRRIGMPCSRRHENFPAKVGFEGRELSTTSQAPFSSTTTDTGTFDTGIKQFLRVENFTMSKLRLAWRRRVLIDNPHG